MLTFNSEVQLKSTAKQVESNVSGIYFGSEDRGIVLNPAILELPKESGERNSLVTVGFTRGDSWFRVDIERIYLEVCN